MARKRRKAIGLLSGGLDSSLAVKLLLDQGVEVICLNMKTPFCLCDGEGRCYSDSLAEKYNLRLVRVYGGEDYLEIVRKPKHGYGRNMNPCIDCRIYLFTRAKALMEKEGADFVFTGEVLGERPMSQRRDALRLVEKESGLTGKILRPLSARLLEPTIPEKKGWVNREKLLSIRGRSRKPQIALAQALQVKDYPCPAGGCLLTDENFAKRLRDCLDRAEDSLRDISLLKIGRHFRLPSGAKVIAGRNEAENKRLMVSSYPEELKFTVKGYKSTYVLLLGEATPENSEMAARVCARYCKEKSKEKLRVKVWNHNPEECATVEVTPLSMFEAVKFKI
jgi:tRNA U34 2-thiouridine synthase MnmA/TrmU